MNIRNKPFRKVQFTAGTNIVVKIR